MPTGTVCVPSTGGISHLWSEDTKEDDMVLGGQVTADSAAALLALVNDVASQRAAGEVGRNA